MTVIFTSIAVIYIHLQMQIFDLAYRGKQKEKEIHDLMDTNGTIESNILAMKSANHLGVKLLNENSGMQFLDDQNVVKIAMPASFLNENQPVIVQSSQKRTGLLANLFTLRAQAEAQSIK